MHRSLFLFAPLTLVACSPFLPVGDLDEDEGSGTTTATSASSTDSSTSGEDGLDPNAPPVLPPTPTMLPPSGPGVEVAMPGSRLSPVVIRVEDAMSFVTWRDRELGVDCEFVDTQSGLRCLPTARHVVLDGPACDQPAAAVSPGEPTPAVLIEAVGGNCAAFYRAYRVLDEESTPNRACYTGDDQPPPAIRAVEPMSDADFVAGTLAATAGVGFADHVLQADDGAWQLLGPAYDGTPCDVRDYAGTEVCVDTRPWSTFLCANHVLGCEAAPHGLVYGGECEAEIVDVVELGTQVPAAEACGESWEDMRAQPIGNSLALGDLPRSTPALLGQGRVRVRAIADTTLTPRWPQRNFDLGSTARLFDTRLGVPCDVRYDAADGAVTCVPAIGIGYASQYFVDPGCTIPAFEGAIDPSLIEVPERCEFLHYTALDPIMGYVRVDAEEQVLYGVAVHDGPIYTHGEDERCVLAERPRLVARMYRPVGGRLPDDFLATVEKVELR